MFQRITYKPNLQVAEKKENEPWISVHFQKETQTFFEAFATIRDLVEDVAVVSEDNEQCKDGDGSEHHDCDKCYLRRPSVAVIFFHFESSEKQKP